MQRSTDNMTDSFEERRHCTDHTGQDARLVALDQKLDAKMTLLMWILGGVGGTILMVLVYNQGRIDAQEKITAMLQANMITVEKQVAKLETEIHNVLTTGR